MKDLIKKQNEERLRIHMKCLSKSQCAKDCGEDTVIKLGYAVSIVEEEIAKVRKETAEAVCDKIIGENPNTDIRAWQAIDRRRTKQKELKQQILKEIN